MGREWFRLAIATSHHLSGAQYGSQIPTPQKLFPSFQYCPLTLQEQQHRFPYTLAEPCSQLVPPAEQEEVTVQLRLLLPEVETERPRGLLVG